MLEIAKSSAIPFTRRTMMRFYVQQHQFYCGIDLHARTMHVCILDQAGQVVVDKNIPASPKPFLDLLAPYRDGIVVGAECMFAWYWIADLCQQHHLPFVLGHALYMKAIHGGKAKNDRIDARKIAHLLRGGNFPIAYAYPKGMRETRDLLRRRMYLVHKRAELLTHVQILNVQCNLPPFGEKLSLASNRAALNIAERFQDASVRKSVEVDLALVEHMDTVIDELESYLRQTVQVDDVQSYQLLQTVPGIGLILALVLLYEMHEVARFTKVGQFLSYARLVRCHHESAGKKLGTGGNKIGNAHLKWAFGEAACLFLRFSERAKKWKQRYAQKHGAGKALSALAAKLGRAVYHMLRKKEAFDEERFWNSGTREKLKGPGAGVSVGI
jgi:transposase